LARPTANGTPTAPRRDTRDVTPSTDIDAAVLTARRRYAEARPNSAEWAARARRVMPGGNTRSVLHFEPFPLRVDRAEGRYLWDVDGHRYVDLLGNYTAGLLGHSPTPVIDAARAAIAGGISLGSVHADEVRLAEMLVERFPSIESVRFTNSGTEANLMALALATHHTGRSKIVVFRRGYHGGVLSFGRDDNPVNVPHDWLLVDYDDTDGVQDAFDAHASDIAAVLVEPMQGAGGCIPGDPAFLARLRSLCTEHGSALIFDEVMTSRFSTGGAQLLLGITPDMTTLGKYLAGGLTFGAFGGRRDLMVHFDRSSGGALEHAGTFNNNVASMAAGVAALTEVLTGDVLDDVHARGERLRAMLGETFREQGVALCVTGMGSLMNIHGRAAPVRTARDLDGVDDRMKELFFFSALEAGFYLAPRGFIALSIEITDDDVEAFVAHVRSG
jgi:glutamate-1-semialdehyde 2,1-aminomutase